MKKSILCALGAIAVSAALSGCSMTGEPTPTVEPIDESAVIPEASIPIYSEYALIDGYFSYDNPDWAFSIQLPDGSTVNNDDPENVVMSISGTFANPDTIIVSKDYAPVAADSASSLLSAIGGDRSITINAFYTLTRDDGYAGYKYTYTSVDDPQLKGIKSVYMSTDGTAYTINATIYNGGDDANVLKMNTIVDTFINRK
ncbi:MAG: hypothetical protein IJH37_06450 [Clostridia bacterium]|nr:hypothetical protein [Clostridia bacterium]